MKYFKSLSYPFLAISLLLFTERYAATATDKQQCHSEFTTSTTTRLTEYRTPPVTDEEDTPKIIRSHTRVVQIQVSSTEPQNLEDYFSLFSSDIKPIITSYLGDNDLLNFRVSAKLPAEFVEMTFKNRSQVQTPLVCLREHPHPITISYFLRKCLFDIWKISIGNILQKSKSFRQCADFCKLYNYKGEHVFRYLGSINPESPPSEEELDQELEDKLLEDKLFVGYEGHDMDNLDNRELALSAYAHKIKKSPNDEKIMDNFLKLAKETIDKGGKAFALPHILGYAKFFKERIGLTHPALKRLSQFAADNDSIVGQAFLSSILFKEGKVEDAKTYARKAADQGDIERQVFLGGIFLKERNFKDAKYYLKKAAQGRSCLKYKAADEEALRPCRGYAFYSLSEIAAEEGKWDKVREYDQQGANLGDPRCQYNLALALEDEGRLVDAVQYLRLSAEQGFQPAIDSLREIRIIVAVPVQEHHEG